MADEGEQKLRRVVVIEDDPAMIQLIALILENHGFEVISATGGPEGLEAIAREKPDLVLLDLMMPGMSGWDVYQQMKADEYMETVPVIVVTAKVQDYITKPFGPAELLNSIARVLDDENLRA
jgi:two-component system response regulator VicR